MDTEKIEQRPFFDESFSSEVLKSRSLVLHNDSVNTFEFVIETLIDVCKHGVIQAEQCAFITHYNGKCEVRLGTFDSLKPMKDTLIEKGLSVTIE